MPTPQVRFPAGATVPAIGQGTWHMGEQASRRDDEIRALQLGVDLGLTLIDTAEMYGDGSAEEVVGKAIRGRRDKVFLVSKVLPSNARHNAVIDACERSLKRLATDRLDLYLLHWRSSTPLEETLSAFEQLIKQGKIRHYGVSNFDADDMQELAGKSFGQQCQTNQVLYNLGSRGIDFDLLPLMAERHIPVMAYCPLAQAGALDGTLWKNAQLRSIAEKHQATVGQILLAWSIRPQANTYPVLAIPKATEPQHVRENAAALDIQLDAQDLALLDRAFPAPTRKVLLDII
ncbi:aldo/keto reductase [Azomonas macrocytogenes]|uniref:Diketogulonate reductase-like aldo/keto reductase n=1 Tax=Azomonas macrocytogenes TaxID=69962 RepID=A0A839T2Z3_AZOMA|nr:aldo/keto reductase [Azomonas macrocytogenes]MBB3102335.1 diketogulonate reductase-like aldo/keto reductase [Azomonas macrocytogenes]